MFDLFKYKNPKQGSNGNDEDVSTSGNFNADSVAGIAGGLSSIISTATDIADDGDPNFDDELNRIRNQTFSPSGTYSLMNQYNNMYLGAPKTWSDFGGKTSGDYAKGILGSTLSGTATGAKYGPYGALAGFVIGLGAGTIGMFSNQAKTKANEKYYYNKKNENFNIALNNWNTANDALKTNQFDRALKGFYQSAEDGGLLSTHGSDFTNNIKYINVGGTHEQNPNRGVQMGVDEEGTPNLVEEGEVIFNDYVFSARLKPSKKALNDSLIGDKYLGLTYAEIAEKLAEKSEEMPNDKIEQNTLNANFSRLITIQEEQRAKKQEREANEFEGGGDIKTKRQYNLALGKFRLQARNYALSLAPDGSEKYKEIYEKKFNELSAETTKQWEERQKLQAEKSNNYANERARLDKMVQYMEEAGYSVPELEDPGTRERVIDYRKVENRYNQLVNSGIMPPMSSNQNDINKQTEKEASRVAKEVVGESDKSGATATSNPASLSESDSNFIGPPKPSNFVQPSGSSSSSSGVIPTRGNSVAEGAAFEQQQYYQDFLKFMADNPDARQEWIDAINAGNFGPMGGVKIKDYDDWLNLATDKNIGPVHNATLLAANNWANTEFARRAMNGDMTSPIETRGSYLDGAYGELKGDPYLNGAFKVQTPKEDIIRESSLASGKDEKPKNGEPKDYSYLLRYAPVLGNALALLGNRKDYSDVRRFEAATANPRTVRFSPIGTYIRPNLVAPSELSVPIENQMANERNYISNNSLGNSTASNNYMLAADYLGNSRIGAAYLQGKQYNAEQRQKAAAYNLGIDQYNSEGAFKEQQQNMSLNNYYLQRALYDYNMRNNIDMAYDQARSSNLTAMFNNIGNIGLDTFNRRRANEASPAYKQLSDGEIAYLRELIGG